MKELNNKEIDAVSGGFAVFGISGIETGLALFAQATAVGKALSACFAFGVGVGSAINYGYSSATGSTIGVDAYEFIHC